MRIQPQEYNEEVEEIMFDVLNDRNKEGCL